MKTNSTVYVLAFLLGSYFLTGQMHLNAAEDEVTLIPAETVKKLKLEKKKRLSARAEKKMEVEDIFANKQRFAEKKKIKKKVPAAEGAEKKAASKPSKESVLREAYRKVYDYGLTRVSHPALKVYDKNKDNFLDAEEALAIREELIRREDGSSFPIV